MAEESDLSARARQVLLNGRQVAAGAVASDLQSGDARLVADVVRQVLDDRAQRRPRSEALILICAAFRPRITLFLRQFFPNDPSALEEVWNDTLERAYYRIERYDSRKSAFGTWLFNQARYVSLERLRQLQRTARREFPAGWLEERVENDPLAEVLDDKTEQLTMRRAFLRMNDLDQKLLFLRLVLSCRNVEIARHRLVRELPEEHVRVYVNRAAQKLRKLFEDEEAAGAGEGREALSELDEVWAIERVVGELEGRGEYEGLACLEADLGAARLGHLLRRSFDPSLAGGWLRDEHLREYQEAANERRREEIVALTDAEAEALLGPEVLVP
jgi:RNA polymerase sigma factor (sigma-70 family)